MKAFIEVTVARGKAARTLRDLRRIEEVQSVSVVTGHCDIVVTIDVPDIETLSKVIADRIQSLEGVVRTETLVCLPM